MEAAESAAAVSAAGSDAGLDENKGWAGGTGFELLPEDVDAEGPSKDTKVLVAEEAEGATVGVEDEVEKGEPENGVDDEVKPRLNDCDDGGIGFEDGEVGGGVNVKDCDLARGEPKPENAPNLGVDGSSEFDAPFATGEPVGVLAMERRGKPRIGRAAKVESSAFLNPWPGLESSRSSSVSSLASCRSAPRFMVKRE